MTQDIDTWNESVGKSLPDLPKPWVLDDCKPTVETRDIEGLAWSHEGDRLVGHFGIERRNRHMMVTREEQIAMDLIRADDHVAANADLGDPFQFPPGISV